MINQPQAETWFKDNGAAPGQRWFGKTQKTTCENNRFQFFKNKLFK